MHFFLSYSHDGKFTKGVGGTASPGFELVSQLGSFCVFLSVSRLKERTRAQTLGLNQTVLIYNTKWAIYKVSGKVRAPDIHRQEGERCSTLARGSTLHSSQSLHTCSVLTPDTKLPNTYAQESGKRVTGRVQEVYVQTSRTRKPLGKPWEMMGANVCLNNGPAARSCEPPP